LIVLDASAVVSVLLGFEPAASRIRCRLWREDPNEPVHVPHIFDVEVLQALRRHAMRGALSESRGIAALDELSSLRATRYPHSPLARRIWELRRNLTAYDAAYVALAESLDAPLVTMDARLAQAPGHGAGVELYR
jgi:predicted nucleic acid-binding protein